MKITCTAPNGMKFEGEAYLLKGDTATASSIAANHNNAERAAIQTALETWCRSFGVDPKGAKEE